MPAYGGVKLNGASPISLIRTTANRQQSAEKSEARQQCGEDIQRTMPAHLFYALLVNLLFKSCDLRKEVRKGVELLLITA